MCQKSEGNALGNLQILNEAPYENKPDGSLPVFSQVLRNDVVKCLWVILVVGTVTDSSQFTWDFSDFKTESLTLQKTPQSWANWNG